jgi:DNA-damage-inducible protein J
MKIQTSVRVEDEFYKEAKVVFKRFGLSFGDAVNLFLSKVSMEQAIPFIISIPKKEENISTKSFEKIWDNEEDDEYDKFLSV